MDMTKNDDFDQWRQIISYNFYDMCKDIDIMHSYYHTNALQYFMAYFLLCTDENYMFNSHPNLCIQYYTYLDNVISNYKKELENKKEYYFNYALRYFFPNTIRNIFNRIPSYESFAYLVYNKGYLFNYAIIEDMKNNSSNINMNEVDSFLKNLLDTFIPQLQQYRLKFKKIYIKRIIDKIHSDVVHMSDVDHIDFYCICEDKANTDIDLSTQIDNHILTFDSLKQIVKKESFIDILLKMYFIWNIKNDLKKMIKLNLNIGPCIFNLISIDNNFIYRLDSTLFFIITFKDGEVRLYLNTHFGGIFEIVKGTVIQNEIFGLMLNTNSKNIYQVDDFKGLPNILFDGDIYKLISEFTFYYSSLFKGINYMRHFFTYNNIEKDVMFV